MWKCFDSDDALQSGIHAPHEASLMTYVERLEMSIAARLLDMCPRLHTVHPDRYSAGLSRPRKLLCISSLYTSRLERAPLLVIAMLFERVLLVPRDQR
jgi:hypothetical protein